jgi:16S rRNA processing protein RimM
MGATSSSRSSPTPSDRRRAVARVLGVKGLKGGVRIELLTDWPEELVAGAELWPEGSADPMRVSRVESGGRSFVLHFDGIGSREAAEPLVGRFLERPTRALDPDAYYWDDLVGLRVETSDGDPVGELVEVFRAGGNEVYRIVGEHGERLVPALRSAVLRIDLEAGLMVVAPDDAEEVR